MTSRAVITIEGVVQGVGFRPFLFRLAEEMSLFGRVRNTAQGVVLDAEGPDEVLNALLARIPAEKPRHARIESIRRESLPPLGYSTFEIEASQSDGKSTAWVLPDIATCPDCLREILDPCDRRYLYPFTNCTNCGPRFSILRDLPYDRPNTTMSAFAMCPACREEYDDPRNRRFHAQPNACPACGPQLALWDETGAVRAERHEALLAAAEAIRAGRIAAIKGIGGFQLVVDARNEDAVRRLRERKHREEKPFALMLPSAQHVRPYCRLYLLEEQWLLSPEAPIVLLERRAKTNLNPIAPPVAPGNPYLGVMLPYSPLHHILMRELNFPIVATSGNASDEPICIDEGEALERLKGLADVFLVHNRAIVRHVDDSVLRVILGRETILRRARGFAPLPIVLEKEAPATLAVGAHLKNTVAVNAGRNVFLSQHIGDLETEESNRAFEEVIRSLSGMYELTPVRAVCDLHPDYRSTQYAQSLNIPVTPVQHHYAHVLSCMAENGILDRTVLGVSWDGTGYGTDGTIWGGEFLLCRSDGFRRAAHLRTFRLPSGDKAVKEPRRTALGLLYEAYGEDAFAMADLPPLQTFSPTELETFKAMLRKGLNSPRTSSAGRLFDGAASLADLRQRVSFEGQAAMEFEFALTDWESDERYSFDWREGEGSGPALLDWKPMLDAMVEDVRSKQPIAEIALRFHNTLVEMIVEAARKAGKPCVALSGGCFQNRYLIERAVRRLREEGFEVFRHRSVPTNDGGIALGQMAAVWKGQ